MANYFVRRRCVNAINIETVLLLCGSAPWGWPSRGGAVLYRLSPQLGEDPPC